MIYDDIELSKKVSGPEMVQRDTIANWRKKSQGRDCQNGVCWIKALIFKHLGRVLWIISLLKHVDHLIQLRDRKVSRGRKFLFFNHRAQITCNLHILSLVVLFTSAITFSRTSPRFVNECVRKFALSKPILLLSVDEFLDL